MKLMPLMILAAILWPKEATSNEEWAFVPADRGSKAITGFDVSGAPTEENVKLIGAVLVTARSDVEPHKVIALGIPSLPKEDDSPISSSEPSAPKVPADARWPDAEGRIAASLSKRDDRDKGAAIRNPWDVRIAPKATSRDSAFQCSGIIVGGEGGSVALLNGRVVRQGDSLGEFGVAGVLTNAVLLERIGLYFVIPVGRRTMVTISDG
jgi:hypothetical protein